MLFLLPFQLCTGFHKFIIQIDNQVFLCGTIPTNPLSYPLVSNRVQLNYPTILFIPYVRHFDTLDAAFCLQYANMTVFHFSCWRAVRLHKSFASPRHLYFTFFFLALPSKTAVFFICNSDKNALRMSFLCECVVSRSNTFFSFGDIAWFRQFVYQL